MVFGRSLELLRFRVGEQQSGQSEVLVSEAVGEQAVVTDADETPGEHMEEEAAQELTCSELHGALLSVVGIVLPAEGDLFAVEGQQAVVGDGDAVGIAAEITQHLLGSSQGLLGIYDPGLTIEWAHQTQELLPILVLGRRSFAG